MSTSSKAYRDEDAARRDIAALRATGVPGRDIRLLTGRALQDTRREPVGGFAGPVAPSAPVGSFGGTVLQRRHGTGSFAGDPDRQRQGSFGDVDRVVVVSHQGDRERSRVTGLRGARRLLRGTDLDDHAVERAMNEVRAGHSLVVIDVTEIAPSDARAPLAHAA
jgi:hypothetical protein